MKIQKTQAISIILVALSFLSSVYVYPLLPEKMASHWDFNGTVDGYAGREFGAFFIPFLCLAIAVLLSALPSLDPYKSNYREFQAEYDNFVAIILGFFLYIHTLTLAFNLNYSFNLLQLTAPGFAILYLYAGTLIEKAKRNWFVGIRTPWTLSSEQVWAKTHRIAGSMFKAAGIVALLGLFLPSIGLAASVAVVLAAAIFSFVYSYLEFQKEKTKGASEHRR